MAQLQLTRGIQIQCSSIDATAKQEPYESGLEDAASKSACYGLSTDDALAIKLVLRP